VPARGSARRRSRRADPGGAATLDRPDYLLAALGAGAVFVAVWVTLFSSLFTNFPAGVFDSFGSLAIWAQRVDELHVTGPLTYLFWMGEQEIPLLALGLGGAAFVAWEGRSRFAIFAAAWATGLLLAYSLIGYKVPWLMLNWLLPYALVAGYVVGRAWAARRRLVQVVALGTLAAVLALSSVQAVQLAFRDYDNEENAYVYVQTTRDLLDLVAWLRAEDERRGTGGQLGIVIMSPDHWPLPWYLRDNERAGYYGEVVDVEAPVQIVREDQLDALPAEFDARYREHGRFTLRAGVELVVFVERDS
jgi:uncharacterized protein (TIGR03663 family)